MKHNYPDSRSDLFAGFIERVMTMVVSQGYMAQVTMQSWMFLSSYEKLRLQLRHQASIVTLLHMDNMVMRIAFGTSATVWKIGIGGQLAGKYTWITLDDLNEGRPRRFPPRNARNATAGADGHFTLTQADFDTIPGFPIVYWLTEKVLHVFRGMDTLGMHSRAAKGLVTADNATFVRCWWEVSRDKTGFDYASREEARSSKKRWFPYANGGLFRKWAGNVDSVVDWEDDGRRLQTTLTTDGCRIRATNFNLNRIFLPAIVWTVVTSGEQSFRVAPRGSLFDAAAGMCQSNKEEILLAVLNSRVAALMLSALNPTLNLHPGYLEAVPIPANVSAVPVEPVKCLVKLSENDWNSRETSWEFTKNPLVALTEQK
ncbi:hypothetical protein EII12_02030 [Buchananella hordeovulneris]|uniref:hypothetical protein n=1 Tax=Buchananella hordeovulneris TaxID=52770 RepID=UPI000F5DF327|nr:hypothetical protein [Buchananella hordeovulneris]RRD53429.1 hypothetical protein EII12_02030 [Buchananella hordeovulneris]